MPQSVRRARPGLLAPLVLGGLAALSMGACSTANDVKPSAWPPDPNAVRVMEVADELGSVTVEVGPTPKIVADRTYQPTDAIAGNRLSAALAPASEGAPGGDIVAIQVRLTLLDADGLCV